MPRAGMTENLSGQSAGATSRLHPPRSQLAQDGQRAEWDAQHPLSGAQKGPKDPSKVCRYQNCSTQACTDSLPGWLGITSSGTKGPLNEGAPTTGTHTPKNSPVSRQARKPSQAP